MKTWIRPKFLGMFTAALLTLVQSAYGQDSVIDARSSAETFAGIREADIKAKVSMPAGKAKSNALLIVNSSSGKDDVVMTALAQAAVASGIASVTLDTYTPRGIIDTVRDQEKISLNEQLADIFAVLTKMRSDPRFEGQKIALGGHSRGGTLAYMASHADLGPFLEKNVPRFDAYVALSPDCQPTFKGDKLLNPLRLISGEKDNWTKPEPCQRQVEKFKAAGQTASMVIIPGVSHSFSTNGVHIGSAVKFACPPDKDYFYVSREQTGKLALLRDPTQPESETARAMWIRCAGLFGANGRGALAGGSREKMPEALQSGIEFLQAQGF